MLLFKKRFHDGLKSGSITLTYRLWPKPQVKPGGRYRCHPIGVVDVDSIERVQVGDIPDSDARRAGFRDRGALLEYMSEIRPIDDATEVFRIELRYGGDGDRVPAALDADLSPDDVEAISARLAKLDAGSAEGPWTDATLGLIARYPRIAASKLARRLGRDTPSFKAGVVKLKKLGLTQSFEVGYEISPRGQAFLDMLREEIKQPPKPFPDS